PVSARTSSARKAWNARGDGPSTTVIDLAIERSTRSPTTRPSPSAARTMAVPVTSQSCTAADHQGMDAPPPSSFASGTRPSAANTAAAASGGKRRPPCGRGSPAITRAPTRIGAPHLDGREEAGQLRRVVLEIGVLGHDHTAGGGGDAAPERRTLAAVRLMVKHLLDEPGAHQAVEDGAGVVGRRIVHGDHLE